MEEHTEDAKIDEETARFPVSLDVSISTNINSHVNQVKIAVYASLVSNVILCFLQREVHLNH